MLRTSILIFGLVLISTMSLAEESKDETSEVEEDSTEVQGDGIASPKTLDELARPVDKEVFLRELTFYEIRSAE